ncbi:RNA polymerase sigma factor [Aestuariibaculum suncheonense]|uniref:Sigma-70 family RNA polymerase sigma factor n=1 Tax=Aestuariibaculum suncheonense TaxID=1028745 RepID=A0A8J6UCN3_9FLAO|nr:sigma-70 family RNA polymerase sigma factor [Aestuariibaculum suncheonense]MBD0836447.1 sigma-70 family RNA polymerase sigma factor [Aestuariibaculum suncheonense]
MPKSIQENICEERLFSSIFNKYAKDLHNFLYYKFGEELNPKDKVQEAFVKLWENCAKVTPEKAKSFVFTTANNLMLNEAAHQKVILKYRQTKPKTHTNENPEFLMQENEYRKKLQQALANLTDAQREAFLMNRVEGKRFKEIAELLDISTKAVEKRIYGALEKLKKDIKEL